MHELVVTQELVRIAARGYGDGLQGGMVIGLRASAATPGPTEV